MFDILYGIWKLPFTFCTGRKVFFLALYYVIYYLTIISVLYICPIYTNVQNFLKLGLKILRIKFKSANAKKHFLIFYSHWLKKKTLEIDPFFKKENYISKKCLSLWIFFYSLFIWKVKKKVKISKRRIQNLEDYCYSKNVTLLWPLRLSLSQDLKTQWVFNYLFLVLHVLSKKNNNKLKKLKFLFFAK